MGRGCGHAAGLAGSPEIVGKGGMKEDIEPEPVNLLP